MGDTIILGAGPAGLAAAWRLTQAGEPVVVVEREATAGGLCRSFQIDGCRFDNGPHLFKARNERVASLWDMLSGGDYAPQRTESTGLYFDGGLHRSMSELVLRRPRREVVRMGIQLLTRAVWPRPVESGEDWLRNVRGDAIYRLLYQPREEKFWGASLSRIDPGWYSSQAASLGSRLANRVVSDLRRKLPGRGRIAAERQTPEEGAGLFPARGSGGLYQRLQGIAAEAPGNRFLLGRELVRVDHADGRVRSVRVRDLASGEVSTIEGSSFVSTIPLPVLVGRLAPSIEADVAADAARLFYRDLVTVNLVVEAERPFPVDIVHVFSGELDALRITNFAGLSAAMSDAAGRLPICIEYNCFRGDELWRRSDAELVERASRELERMGLASARSVVDAAVVRFPEAYPVHVIGYRAIVGRLLACLAQLPNLQSIGRNGIFTYNQMSHSVESGLLAAENVLGAGHVIDVPAGSLFL